MTDAGILQPGVGVHDANIILGIASKFKAVGCQGNGPYHQSPYLPEPENFHVNSGPSNALCRFRKIRIAVILSQLLDSFYHEVKVLVQMSETRLSPTWGSLVYLSPFIIPVPHGILLPSGVRNNFVRIRVTDW